MPSRQHSSTVARTLCDAAAVALDARQAALLRPAAVAVHDDGDVLRQPRGVEAGLRQPLQRVGLEGRRGQSPSRAVEA